MEKEKDKNKDDEKKVKLNLSDMSLQDILILSAITIIACGVVVYIIFSKTSMIPAGIRLTRADWLSFIGDYLSFAGTVGVSIIALWQTKHYNNLDEKHREEDRMRSVQPIFSIEVKRNPHHVLSDSNAIIGATFVNYVTIKNVGQTPVSHVFAFNKYQTALLQPDKTIEVFCIFSGFKGKINIKDLIILTEDSFDRNKDDLPKYFNINYDDIDGRKMCQTFELIDIGGEYIYSLEETFEL